MNQAAQLIINLEAVIVAVTEEVPRVLTVARSLAGDTLIALPFGPLDPRGHATLEKGLRQWVARQTGFQLGHVEQLYTFGDQFRDPRERSGGPRVVSAAYLALVREQEPPKAAWWRDWYSFLPWEDWRQGRPWHLDEEIAPALNKWAHQHPVRRERIDLCFGLGGAPWDHERTLERYELLYEAGLVSEAGGSSIDIGRRVALDHRRILATALGRLRGKLKYRPVVFELLPTTFTLLKLQRVVEALAGSRLHKQNFRRLVAQAGLVEATGQRDQSAGGRPAELFRFRREVLHERPAPGVHFSGAKWEGR